MASKLQMVSLCSPRCPSDTALICTSGQINERRALTHTRRTGVILRTHWPSGHSRRAPEGREARFTTGEVGLRAKVRELNLVSPCAAFFLGISSEICHSDDFR